MVDQHSLIFLTDPKRFMALVTEDDVEKRWAVIETPEDLVLCEIIRYGCYNREEMIQPLAQFYRQFAMRLPEETRFELSRYVLEMVETSGFVSINAFLPFIAEDDSRLIVSTSVIDYVSLGHLDGNDPMSRVKDILAMIEDGTLKNEGAAFGALLHIGDPRVCKLLRPLRDALDLETVNEAVRCQTGFIHAATADFYLDWLEGMEGDVADGKFGLVASGLGLLRKRSQTDQVGTGHRPFPTRGASPEQWAMLKPISLTEYVEGIAPRMYALERAEPPPRIMPDVLMTWGLTPKTDPSEMAQQDDRAKTEQAALARPEPIAGGRIVDVSTEWWDGEGHIFLVWGILNPNGPTLYVLGSRDFDGRQRLFFRWLHMLGGRTTYAAEAVDTLTYQGIYDDADRVHRHLSAKAESGLFHVIPTFLIVNGGDETLSRIAKRLMAGGTAANENWGRHMAYVRRFGSDFFGMAGAEIRESYESGMAQAKAAGQEPSEYLAFVALRYGHLPEFRDAEIPEWTDTAMTPELLEEWWSTVTEPAYQRKALLTLKVMWEGAASLMAEDLKQRLVPWPSVLGFLERYGLIAPAC